MYPCTTLSNNQGRAKLGMWKTVILFTFFTRNDVIKFVHGSVLHYS